MIQVKYRAASEKLAIQMQSGLTEIWQPQDVAVQGIPLSVLKGADMPAVAIEIGNLANANAEKELADNRFLTRIAEVIVAAITAFLAEKP
jgi:N-acetylmuramoyl-L-alanine amidase